MLIQRPSSCVLPRGVVGVARRRRRPARVGLGQGDPERPGQRVREADQVVTVPAGVHDDRRDVLVAVHDDPADAGGQLDEREGHPADGLAQGHGGRVSRGGIHRIGVGAVDDDGRQAPVSRVGDVLDREPPRVPVRGAVANTPSGPAVMAGRQAERLAGGLSRSARPSRRRSRPGRARLRRPPRAAGGCPYPAGRWPRAARAAATPTGACRAAPAAAAVPRLRS